MPPSDPRRQEAPAAHEEHHGHLRHEHPRWSVGRVAFLAISAICIYLFAPSIAEVFSAYDRLGDVEPIWLLPAVLCALGSFACVWLVQAIALGHARLVLGGHHPAGGERVQPHHARRRRDRHRVAGEHARRCRLRRRVRGNRAHRAIGAEHRGHRRPPRVRAAVRALRHPGPRRPAAGVLDRHPRVPAHGRDRHRAVRRRPPAAVPRPGHRVGALQVEARRVDRPHARARGCSRAAIASGGRSGPGGRSRWVRRWRAGCSSTACSSARCAGCRRTRTPRWCCWPSWWRRCSGLLPFTPGGLGFVEAGLAATLAVAGISTGDALVATLVYRMLTFWLPIPLGGVAAYVFRRRHPHQVPAGAAPATPS